MLARRRFDVDEYYRMADAGILTEDERVELIDGEIVRMSAIGTRHAACLRRLTRILGVTLGDRAQVSGRNPVRLDRYSEPEPDIALLRPRADDYTGAHPVPGDVLLLIEVADSSLPFDRERKLPLYAAAGIPEVWIVDLTTDAVEVHREPGEGGYSRSRRLTDGAISAEVFPQHEIDVGDILPPAG